MFPEWTQRLGFKSTIEALDDPNAKLLLDNIGQQLVATGLSVGGRNYVPAPLEVQRTTGYKWVIETPNL
jgi:hypothetical protein